MPVAPSSGGGGGGFSLRDKRKCAADEQQRTEQRSHGLDTTCQAQRASQGGEDSDENFEEFAEIKLSF